MPPVGCDHMVLRSRHTDHTAVALRQGLCRAHSPLHRVGAVHALGLAAVAREAQDFRGVAAHQRRAARQQVGEYRVAVGARARAHRVEHAGLARCARGVQGELHGWHPLRIEGADVDHHRARKPGQIGHFLDRMGHDGRCARRQQGVGVEGGHHQVGDAVHQRRMVAHGAQVAPDGIDRKGMVGAHGMPLAKKTGHAAHGVGPTQRWTGFPTLV